MWDRLVGCGECVGGWVGVKDRHLKRGMPGADVGSWGGPPYKAPRGKTGSSFESATLRFVRFEGGTGNHPFSWQTWTQETLASSPAATHEGIGDPLYGVGLRPGVRAPPRAPIYSSEARDFANQTHVRPFGPCKCRASV